MSATSDLYRCPVRAQLVCETDPPVPPMDETTLVTLARVAERAERFDEMADFMKQRAAWRLKQLDFWCVLKMFQSTGVIVLHTLKCLKKAQRRDGVWI